MQQAENIDNFIAVFSPEVQSVLQELRALIHREAPGCTEAIKYGIPTFVLNGNLVHFSAYKNHIGFYPGASGIAHFGDKLQQYKLSKGTVQFPLNEPLPFDLIADIVRFRVTQNSAKKKLKKRKTEMEQRITFMTLGVNDLQKSAGFYETTLGWKRSGMSNENILFFEMNGFYLSLYNRKALAEDVTIDDSGSGFRGFTLAYNVGSEQEVNDLIEELRNKGVTIVKEPQKVFWGGYSSYFADPDGTLWEVAYNPFL